MKQEFERFREALLQEKSKQRRLIDNLEARGLAESETESYGELSSYDQHPADQGTETYEREQDTGLREHARQIVERIDHALRRIESGEYGFCEACGRPMDAARLDALPYAVRCITCEEKEEARLRVPTQLDANEAPFAHSFTDGRDQTGYDGEDTWQDLAQYGTANSPQDVGATEDAEEPDGDN